MIKSIIEKVKDGLLKIFQAFSNDYFFNFLNFHYIHLKCLQLGKFNLKSPSTFNQKIIALKFEKRYPFAKDYVDKLNAKSLVKNMIGKDKVIPTLASWDLVDKISFNELPQEFVLKVNHGSGWNIIVNSKEKLNELEAKRKLKSWMSLNYDEIGREYQYQGIKPIAFAEPLLKPTKSDQLYDYKIFCFNGKPKFIQVDIDRFKTHKRMFYDIEWNPLAFTILYPRANVDIPRPQTLSQMIDISEKLCAQFCFVRVDLYDCDGKVLFGELTFHPEGGFGPFIPKEFDKIVGDLLDIED